MPALATTTLETIEPLLVAVIEALAPITVYQESSTWKHYENSKKSPGRTRSFTLRWIPGQFVTGGYFGTVDDTGGVETAATLLVVTDYVGEHEKLQWLVSRDYQQIRDALNTLTADSVTNGIVSLQPSPAGSARVGTTPQARTQLSNRAAHDAGAIQINHTYALTYMVERIAA
jgi:hypothetical protein